MPSTLTPILASLLLAASTASAAITIPTVKVGDAGNPADPVTGFEYGDVAYEYRIGKYEVTNSQYTAFLNAVAKTDTHKLYTLEMRKSGIIQAGRPGDWEYRMRSGFERHPVSAVSFWSAARFANWLTNGQPNGQQGKSTTETGMYDLGGVTNPENDTVTREIDFSAGENGVAIASEDEWYKAAYYDGNGAYTEYPTQSYTAPKAEEPPGGKNSANCNEVIGSPTKVGAYTNSESYYGTFDQGGNVSEWNDELLFKDFRGQRGASFMDPCRLLRSSVRDFIATPEFESHGRGFRVTSLTPIQDPSN